MTYTRRGDGVKFKPGQKVRCWAEGADHRGGQTFIGTFASISKGGRPGLDIAYVNLTGYTPYLQGEIGVWADTMEWVLSPLDPASLRCRDPKFKLKNLDVGKGDRPWSALIGLPDGRDMLLSYPVHGHFYGQYEQPIDLVSQ